MFASPLRWCGPIKNMNGVLAIRSNNIEYVARVVCSIGRVRFASDKGKKEAENPQTVGRRVEPWPRGESVTQTPWRTECSRDPQPPNYDPYRIKVPEVVVPPLPPSNAKAALECAKIKGPCSPKKAPDPPPCPPPPRPPYNWTYVAVTTAFLAIMGLMYKVYLMRQEWEKTSDSKAIWRPRRKTKKPYNPVDLPACVQYLIIGAGAAGWAGYRAIAEHDKTAKVFFITNEDTLPYVHPPMSKHMWWNKEPPDIATLNYIQEGKRHTMYQSDCAKFVDSVKFNRMKKGPAVSVATGWCVVRVDADEHVVWVRTVCGEQPIYYERCLLATGSKAKNLNVFKSASKEVRNKVTTLRTIRDLEKAFRLVRDAKHVTIVGGGLMGTELAWHLGKMNELVERDEDKPPIQFVHAYKDGGILSGLLPAYLGEWAAERVRCESVQLMPNTQVYDAFLTKDKRLQLTLSNGTTLITDYVLVAVGAEPHTELAEPSFLEVDNVNGGFLVNTELEARKHLYAAGDAASIYSQWHDTRLRMEYQGNAEEQGFIAGANMTGHWVPSNMEPHIQLQLGKDLDMEAVGEVGACMPTIALYKPCAEEEAKNPPPARALQDRTKPCYKKSPEYLNRYRRGLLFYLRDETIVGIVFWNIPPIDDRYLVVTEMLRAKPTYKDINMLASLLNLHDTECNYIPPEEIVEIGPCIRNWRVF